MRISVLFCLFTSGILSAQGNLGVNFGLNDDNFGSIENIKTKLTRLGYNSPFEAFSKKSVDSLKNNIPNKIIKVISNVFNSWFNI